MTSEEFRLIKKIDSINRDNRSLRSRLHQEEERYEKANRAASEMQGQLATCVEQMLRAMIPKLPQQTVASLLSESLGEAVTLASICDPQRLTNHVSGSIAGSNACNVGDGSALDEDMESDAANVVPETPERVGSDDDGDVTEMDD